MLSEIMQQEKDHCWRVTLMGGVFKNKVREWVLLSGDKLFDVGQELMC